MLSVDWTSGDQIEFTSKSKTVPDFHLPTKAVIAVPFEGGLWHVFWSQRGKDHAEDYLSRDINYRNIFFFGINYTPCAKRCTCTFICDFRAGGCPKIYAIWPYRISPKGIEIEQVMAIYNLISNGCVVDTWWNFSYFVDTICSLRSKEDPLCSDVKEAIKSKAFTNRNDYAKRLLDTIKSSELKLQEKMTHLEHTMRDYEEKCYRSF